MFDEFSFLESEGGDEQHRIRFLGDWPAGQAMLLNGQEFAFAIDYRTLDDILKLANVSWPGIRLEQLDRFGINAFVHSPREQGKAFCKAIRE